MLKSYLVLAVLSVMPPVGGSDKVVVLPEPDTRIFVPKVVLPEEPLAAMQLPPLPKVVPPAKLCLPGRVVMIPDGREGQVTSYEDGVCRVLAYGEAYVSLWTDDMVEPVYPQLWPELNFGH